MQDPDEKIALSDEVELDLDETSLESVTISDETLENEDKNNKKARKEAKKTAKKLLSPQERKKLWIKRGLIGAGAMFLVIAVLLAIPVTRWPLLSTLGFRSRLVITVQDAAKKPVANASVRLANGVVAASDRFGRASLPGVTLGKKTVTIQKLGYGEKTVTVIAKPGTTQYTEQLKVIGIQLDIDVKNWLSGKPLGGAEASFGESNAASDASGRASLVIPPTDKKTVEISVTAPGFITKTIETETNVVSREIALVPAQKNYFMSKRDGTFDLFSANLDGSDQRKIIEATGKEDASILQLSINRNNKSAVLVANREGKIQNGRLVAGVYAVDLERASIRKVDEGSDVQLFDWADDVIAYSKSAPDLKYDDPAFSRLMSFNSNTNKLSQIESANYFQSSLVAQSKLFYIPADAYRPIENGAVTSYDLLSGAKRTYLPERAMSYLVRSSYQTLDLQDTAGNTFELSVDRGGVKAIDRRSVTPLSIATSPGKQTALWAERRDGQGALIARSLKDGTDRVVVTAPGIASPVRFISESTAIVRVATSQETADYVIDMAAGILKKVVDVSNIGGTGQSAL